MLNLVAVSRSATQGLSSFAFSTPTTLTPLGQTNLIIVPKALLHQWRTEIESHVEEALFSIHIYWGERIRGLHGARLTPNEGEDKITKVKKLQQFDVILTTYETMASRKRSHSDPADRHFTALGLSGPQEGQRDRQHRLAELPYHWATGLTNFAQAVLFAG